MRAGQQLARGLQTLVLATSLPHTPSALLSISCVHFRGSSARPASARAMRPMLGGLRYCKLAKIVLRSIGPKRAKRQAKPCKLAGPPDACLIARSSPVSVHPGTRHTYQLPYRPKPALPYLRSMMIRLPPSGFGFSSDGLSSFAGRDGGGS